MHLIYKVKNKINNKIYIGLTGDTLRRRIAGHKCDSSKNKYNIPFHNAIRKYGFENFEWEILEDNIESREEAQNRERLNIKLYKSDNSSIGYNATSGGDGLDPTKTEIIEKIRKSVNSHYKSKKFNRAAHSKARGGNPVKVYRAICVQKSCGRPNPRPSIYKKGNFVGFYQTQIEACENLNLSPSKVNLCIKGKRQQHKNYIFEEVLD